jgi:hypothetical protein
MSWVVEKFHFQAKSLFHVEEPIADRIAETANNLGASNIKVIRLNEEFADVLFKVEES